MKYTIEKQVNPLSEVWNEQYHFDGGFISFADFTQANELARMFKDSDTETALVLKYKNKDKQYLILSGDHREEYKKLLDNSDTTIKELKQYYINNKELYPNVWRSLDL